MRYSSNIDYLVSSVIYLGSHSYYWARSPENLAKELSLDAQKLSKVFQAFPGIFRQSKKNKKTGQYYYSLQARYALRDGGDTKEPDTISYIEPLSTERLRLLLDFVLQMSEQEKRSRWNIASNLTAIGAAVLAAIAAMFAAFT